MKLLKRYGEDQRGITGLETAIILIAFIVVASVFAYTVLSAGIFSSEKGKEAVYSGLDRARSTMQILGSVVAKDTDTDGNVNELIFMVSNTLKGDAINLTTTTDSDNDGLLSDENNPSHRMTVTYVDGSQTVADMAWSVANVSKTDSDALLEIGELMEITVNVSQLGTPLSTRATFTLELKPDAGSTIVIERTTPGVIDKLTDLN